MQGGHNIQVCHRVRPSINKERSVPCVTVVDNDTIVLNSKPEAKSFTVDKVRCKLGRREAQAFVIASHNGLGVGDFIAGGQPSGSFRSGLWGGRYTEASF